MDSIRWEMLRDAAEDYELLYLLDQAGGDARAFCRRLVSAAMTYERSPETFFRSTGVRPVFFRSTGI